VRVSQIRLRILGESVIEVGDTIVEPSATHLFALLLYLAIERGKLITRAQLASLLFPGVTDVKAAHNLRQLLYRLRRIGVPLESTAAAVRLPGESVVEAPESILTRGTSAASRSAPMTLVLLPSYAPPTDPLSRWLEAYRDEITNKLLRFLARDITRAREGADWSSVEHLAKALLALDPLNETATLGLAEALARSGSKHRAVKLLTDFAEDVGQSHASLALPPRVLQRRISEGTHSVSHPGPISTFIGRAEQIRHLTETWTVARTNRLCVVFVTGESSVGKSRVLEEFLELVRLDGTGNTFALRASPGDRDRPMSIFSDLCRRLLQLPGAAGCAPENLSFAKRLSDASRPYAASVRDTDADTSARNTHRAVVDLLECVAAERPLLLCIDDADHLDSASRSFLAGLPEVAPTAPVLFLVASNQPESITAPGRSIRLGPLSDECSRTLAERLCDEACYTLSRASRDWCVEAAAGNPGHLALLLQHATTLGDVPAAPPNLVALVDARLASLSPVDRHVLQACAIFGSDCCPATIEALTGLTGYDLLVTLERLSEAALVTDSSDGIRCRSALLADRARASAHHVVRRLLHQRAAAYLEQLVADASTSQAMAWRIANHWQAAGERATSLRWRRVCWHQSLSIGQPMAAVDAIRSQLSSSDRINERATLLDDLALALRSAGDWTQLLAALHERRSLSDAVGDDAACRLAMTADVVEARQQAYEDITLLVPDLQLLIRSSQLDSERRLRAARILLIASDNLLDFRLASEAVDAVAAIPPSDASTVVAQEALLIYHAIFGDRSTAIRIADYFEVASSAAAISPRMVTTVTNSLYARRIVEGGDTDYRRVIALYERCASASMAVFAARVASRIGNFLAEDGQFDQAAVWAERARYWYARSADKRLNCDYLSLEFELAVRDGNHGRALILGESFLELFPSYASPRFAKERLVTQVRHRLIADCAPIDEPTITRLLEWHERAKRHGRHDDHMEALWGALRSAGRENEASRLLEDYVTSSRRELRRLNFWLAARTAYDPFWQRYTCGRASEPQSTAIVAAQARITRNLPLRAHVPSVQ
jgi:DNA-binding SARP family transcriptional activator